MEVPQDDLNTMVEYMFDMRMTSHILFSNKDDPDHQEFWYSCEYPTCRKARELYNKYFKK